MALHDSYMERNFQVEMLAVKMSAKKCHWMAMKMPVNANENASEWKWKCQPKNANECHWKWQKNAC